MRYSKFSKDDAKAFFVEKGNFGPEMELESKIRQINTEIDHLIRTSMRELMVGSVEKIKLANVGISIEQKQESGDIVAFTHRFTFNPLGHTGTSMNVMTFHSPSIVEADGDVYMPYDFMIKQVEGGVLIENLYELEELEQELIGFLHEIDYYSMFHNNFSKDLHELFKQMELI